MGWSHRYKVTQVELKTEARRYSVLKDNKKVKYLYELDQSLLNLKYRLVKFIILDFRDKCPNNVPMQQILRIKIFL